MSRERGESVEAREAFQRIQRQGERNERRCRRIATRTHDGDEAKGAVCFIEMERGDMHHFVRGYLVKDVLNGSGEEVGEDTNSVHVRKGVYSGKLNLCEIRGVRAEEVNYMLGFKMLQLIWEDARRRTSLTRRSGST